MHTVLLALFVAAGPQSYVEQHHADIVKELMALVAMPNIASDHDTINANAQALVTALTKRGLTAKLLTDPQGPPAVYGELKQPGAARTLVMYAHYDGQPVIPSQWTVTPPFKPVLVEVLADGKTRPVDVNAKSLDPQWRIYGRSTSDDKLGVVEILSAIDALRGSATAPTSNIKVFFDGEEEAGSPHLDAILRANRDLLAADLWVICDGPAHSSGRKEVYYGVRGSMVIDVTVYGPKRPLHSGHYGNWVPNPAMTLAKLLASMKDDKGHVTIKGFYDDVKPLTAFEKKTSESIREYDAALAKELLVAKPDGGGKPLFNVITQPSLNIRGITAAEATPGSNIIPAEAKASLDERLVAGDDYKRQIERFVAHVRAQGFYVVDHDPTVDERLTHTKVAKVVLRPGAANADRTPMDLPAARAVAKAVQSVSREPIVEVVTGGGTLPTHVIHEVLGTPWVGVAVANHDNNQHGENENVRLQNLWDGVDVVAAILTM